MNRHIQVLAYSGILEGILFLPVALINYINEGSIPGIFLGVLCGTGVSFIYFKLFTSHPQSTLREILSPHFPPWITTPSITLLGLITLAKGTVILLVTSLVALPYFMPEMSNFQFLLLLTTVTAWTSIRSSKSILFGIEIMLVIHIVTIFIIYYKALTSPYMNWDTVKDIGDYVLEMPNVNAFLLVLSVFGGYGYLSVFNPSIQPTDRPKFDKSIPFISLFFILLLLIIPFGLLGTGSVFHYVNPWFSSADSLRFPLGIIERAFYILLFLYINLTLYFGTLNWHMTIKLLLSCLSKPVTKRSKWSERILTVIFCGIAYTLYFSVSVNQIQKIIVWVSVSACMTLLYFVILFLWVLRKETSK